MDSILDLLSWLFLATLASTVLHDSLHATDHALGVFTFL